MIWIIHYTNSRQNRLQSAFEIFRDITYKHFKLLLDRIDCPGSKCVTYSRGATAPHVVINDQSSLSLAIQYFGDDAYTKETHLIMHS